MRIVKLFIAASLFCVPAFSIAKDAPLSEAAQDVACVLAKVNVKRQDELGDLFLPNANRSDAQQQAAVQSVVKVITPPIMACSSGGGWDDKRFERAAFNSFGSMTSKSVLTRAKKAKFDVLFIQAWFDKQPERLRLTLFSSEMPMTESDATLDRLTADLKAQFPKETRYAADRPLLKIIVKSMVLADRIKNNLGAFR
jgi:hypothetical protein